MIEFRRDPETGVVNAYRDGKLVGPVVTMGDMMGGKHDREQGQERRA